MYMVFSISNGFEMSMEEGGPIYVFKLFGGVVSWMSRWNLVIAISTTEAEYMVATHESKEVV